MKVGIRGPGRKRFRKYLDFVVIPPVSYRRAKEYARYRVEFVIDPRGDPKHIRRLARMLRAKVLDVPNAPEGVERVSVQRIYVDDFTPDVLFIKVKNEYLAFDGPEALRAALFYRYSLRERV